MYIDQVSHVFTSGNQDTQGLINAVTQVGVVEESRLDLYRRIRKIRQQLVGISRELEQGRGNPICGREKIVLFAHGNALSAFGSNDEKPEKPPGYQD